MNRSRVIHEDRMNRSRTIPPRVGVGGGVGVGEREACISSHWRHPGPVDNATADSLAAQTMHATLRAEIRGGFDARD